MLGSSAFKFTEQSKDGESPESTLLSTAGSVPAGPAAAQVISLRRAEQAEGAGADNAYGQGTVKPEDAAGQGRAGADHPDASVEKVELAGTVQRFVSASRLYQIAPRRQVRLVPSLFADLGDHFLSYFLIAALCALALCRVYQVHETRAITIEKNELEAANRQLELRWLDLSSERQALSEHGRIRQAATSELKMRAPATEAELMIAIRP